MIKLTDINGRSHYLVRDNIARITEAGVSSQWHGIRAFVKTHGGVTLEVQESADAIAALITNSETAQRYLITSIKYLAGELTLVTMDGAEVTQSLDAGQVVTLK